MNTADEVERDLLPVHDEGPHDGRRQKRIGQIDGALRHRPQDELDEAGRPAIGALQIPMPVHDEGRERLLLGEYVIEGGVHLGESGAPNFPSRQTAA